MYGQDVVADDTIQKWWNFTTSEFSMREELLLERM